MSKMDHISHFSDMTGRVPNTLKKKKKTIIWKERYTKLKCSPRLFCSLSHFPNALL